jgi:hypothetical protein
MVLNHLPRDPRHLRRLLGKHIDISSEEGVEREFLFVVQITQDTGSLTSLSTDRDGLYGDIFLAGGLHVSYCQSLKHLQRTSPCVTVSLDLEDVIGG